MRTLLFFVLALSANAAEPELVSVKKIWSEGKHNAFTDLIRFNDQWLCTFRESTAHVGGDGGLRVIVSKDGDQWESLAYITEKGIDLRDPKLSIMPDSRLMMVAGGSVYEGTKVLKGRQPRVMFSKDGKEWTKPQRTLLEGDWLWRVTWHDKKCYGVTYNPQKRTTDEAKEAAKESKPVNSDPAEWKLRLVVSDDGIQYDTLAHLGVPGHPNETTLRFTKEGEMIALVRREGGNTVGWIGRAKAPYKEWTWHETKNRFGGPNFLILGDAMWAVGRDYAQPVSTKLYRMTPTSYEPVLTLPSGGDTSYAGLVMHDGLLWCSYYSSHEGKKSSIYLAKIKLGQ